MRLDFNPIAATVVDGGFFLLDSAFNLYRFEGERLLEQRSLLALPIDKPLAAWKGALKESGEAVLFGSRSIRYFSVLGGVAHKIELTAFAPEIAAENGDTVAVIDKAGFLTVGSLIKSKMISLAPATIHKPTALFFSSDSRYIFAATEDAQAIIYDSRLHRVSVQFDLPCEVRNGAFIGDGDLLLITANGEITVISFYAKGAIKAHLKLPSAASSALLITKDYAIVGTESGEVAAIELEKFEVIGSQKLLDEPITALKKRGDKLFVLGGKNEVSFVDLGELNSLVTKLFAKEDYHAIRALLSENSFTLLTDRFSELWEKAWKENAFLAAMEALENGESTKATVTAEPFMFDRKIASNFHEALGLAVHFKSLKTAAVRKDYLAIDRLLKLYPILKQSSSGITYINNLKTACEEAIAFAAAKDIESAQKRLEGFNNILPPFVTHIITFPDHFARFIELYNDREWAQLFDWCDRYPICRELPHFKQLENDVKTLEDSLKRTAEAHHYLATLPLIQALQDFAKMPRLNEPVLALLKFLDALGNDRVAAALEIAQEYPFLTDTASFDGFFIEYKNLLERATLAARSGDSDAVRFLTAKLTKLPLFAEPVAFLLRIAYTEEMRHIRIGAAVDWDETLLQYTKYFGVDPLVALAARAQEATDKLPTLSFGLRGYERFGFPTDIVHFVDLGAEKSGMFIHKAMIASMVFILISFVSLAAFLQKNDREVSGYNLYENIASDRPNNK